MRRLIPYIAILAGLLLFIFMAFLYNAIVGRIVLYNSSSYIQSVNRSASTTEPSTEVFSSSGTANPVASSTQGLAAADSTSSAIPVPAAITAAQFASTSASLRAALVNIICYTPQGSTLHSISGSGVIIDPKGIILTNAHVAQYFLFGNLGVSCVIRSGSPATTSYNASLMYISSAWVHANRNILSEAVPMGNGEYDFALLAITSSATGSPLPSQFPSMPLALQPPSSGTPVIIASYGAQFLNTIQIESDLFPTIVAGSVKAVYTFGVHTIDAIALGGSAAAQEGSSGGGIASGDGSLVGIITTSTTVGATAFRSLNGITASYIRAEYATETGQPIDFVLAEPTSTAIANFAPNIPTLESTIAIPGSN